MTPRIQARTTANTLSAGRDARESTYADYSRTFKPDREPLAAFRHRHRRGWFRRVWDSVVGRSR